MCVGIAPDFGDINDSLDFLNPFSVESRYPGIDVSVEEAQEAVKHAEKARTSIREKPSTSNS